MHSKDSITVLEAEHLQRGRDASGGQLPPTKASSLLLFSA
jgi:hypothetical protein